MNRMVLDLRFQFLEQASENINTSTEAKLVSSMWNNKQARCPLLLFSFYALFRLWTVLSLAVFPLPFFLSTYSWIRTLWCDIYLKPLWLYSFFRIVLLNCMQHTLSTLYKIQKQLLVINLVCASKLDKVFISDFRLPCSIIKWNSYYNPVQHSLYIQMVVY